MPKQTYDVVFYTQYPYFLPHFLPVSTVLQERGLSCCYVFFEKNHNEKIAQKTLVSRNIPYFVGEEHLHTINAKVTVFANPYHRREELNTISFYIDHGVGTKSSNFSNLVHQFDYLVVEGDYRYAEMKKHLSEQEQSKLLKFGYSKLDQAVWMSESEKEKWLKYFGLDPEKKTILYAPTFYPSSIERMSKKFPDDFSNCNILVKPHFISLERSRYQKQQEMFKQWSKYSNVYVAGVEDFDLTPFMAVSDLMISDESSAIFEFTALNKPVILNRFLKLRLSYYLFPDKLKKRMDSGMDIYRDIGPNPNTYKEMVKFAHEELENPQRYEAVRKQHAAALTGSTDGKVSQRIVDFMQKHLLNETTKDNLV